MKKQPFAERLSQTGVTAQANENTLAGNCKSNASCIYNDEDWNELAELITSFADGFSAELQKINQEKRRRKMVITLSLVVCAGILTGYAIRKKILSKFRKK